MMGVDVPTTLTFVIVTTFTPGPNNILSASMGALYGYRRTAPFLLGITGGFLAVMVACATLSSALNAFLPRATTVLRFIGAAYILWLAVGVYRSSGRLLENGNGAKPLRFWNGLTLQLVNPKAAAYGLTVYSVFLVSILGQPFTLVWSPIALALVAFTAISMWAFGGQAIRRWLRTPGRARALGVVLAAALVYTALDLAGVISL